MTGSGGYSMAAGLVQACGSLAVVLGLIYLLAHFSRRWLGRGIGFRKAPAQIRIVETRHLAPKKSLMLVEVAGEYLLLGTCGEGVNLIKQIDMLEEIEVVEEPAVGRPLKGAFQEKLEGVMARLTAPALLPAVLKREG